jgi:hypothetical protein
MTAKQIVQLFLPPMYYRLKAKMKYGRPIFNIELTQVEKLYISLQDINARKELTMSDLEGLTCEPLYGGSILMSPGSVIEPNYYGGFQVLQKYAGIPYWNFSPKKLSIQHGYICEMFDWEKKKLDNVNFVWSNEVKRMYAEHTDNPYITAIGAPFFYASSIMTKEEITAEKKRLGKNLLAFPTHSTYYADVAYNCAPFINLLKEQQKKFDTVRVCVYWRDYQRGLVKPYIDAGFECVCCGHLHDPFFLERQKALFEIADATISNALGSYIGYSIYLDKPHWLVPDKFALKDHFGDEGKREVEVWDSSPRYAELRKPFLNNPDFLIMQEQRNIVDKYWGTSCVKSPKEIRSLIEEAYEVSEVLRK